MLTQIKQVIYQLISASRVFLRETLRWRHSVDTGKGIRVFYGHDTIPNICEKASGSIIKCQDLEKAFPNCPAGANIVYLISGALTVFLNAQGYETHGVDISSAVIERIRPMFPDVSFRVGDIRLLEYPDAHFDALISWGTFEHFEDGLQACFDEAWRVLKPGGLLCITVPFYNLRHRLEDRIFSGRAEAAPPRRFY